ncbi:mRNA-decapping enzyme 1B-like [Tachyglossus aculeatus]|uniref:mRNA-decapping enzyme 1B-like n=1 Tax=Tachyglossus aculeatus TaxID=9261 RepID=UPI0018F4514C|nr:mRNA-decapping enzyme 1B-like [Tachyglossus aculeatus]XP_038623942.1 mRNA-decapping enzyme 1B-like [Tachyglossus aculeatus]
MVMRRTGHMSPLPASSESSSLPPRECPAEPPGSRLESGPPSPGPRGWGFEESPSSLRRVAAASVTAGEETSEENRIIRTQLNHNRDLDSGSQVLHFGESGEVWEPCPPPLGSASSLPADMGSPEPAPGAEGAVVPQPGSPWDGACYWNPVMPVQLLIPNRLWDFVPGVDPAPAAAPKNSPPAPGAWGQQAPPQLFMPRARSPGLYYPLQPHPFSLRGASPASWLSLPGSLLIPNPLAMVTHWPLANPSALANPYSNPSINRQANTRPQSLSSRSPLGN